MRIERFKEDYRADVERLVGEFYAESLDEYGIRFDRTALGKTIDDLKDTALLAVVDGHAQGLIAGKDVKSPYSEDKIWHEVIWFTSRDYRMYGLRLLIAARSILKAEGYTAMVMVYMHNSKSDKLDRLYRRLGYKAMETNFIGRL